MTIAEYLEQHPHIPRSTTVAYLIRGDEVLLATKKVRFGAGKIKGIGGKVDEGETLEACIKREVKEEIDVDIITFEHVATIDMYFPYEEKNFLETDKGLGYSWDQRVEAFIVTEWEGIPGEGEEVRPEWFKIDEVPYDRAWADSKYWLPRILKGEKLQGGCLYAKDYTIEDTEMNVVWPDIGDT